MSGVDEHLPWRSPCEPDDCHDLRGAVVRNNVGVHPSDREVWQWLPQRDRVQLEEWADAVQAELPRLPAGSVLYDIDTGLERREQGDECFAELLDDFHKCTLHAFQRATNPGDSVYAIEEPEACYLYSYRYWPHRASDDTRWYVTPVPGGDHQFFVSQDFRWGILGLFESVDPGPNRYGWGTVCVFGQPLIDAYAVELPRAFNTRLDEDALQ